MILIEGKGEARVIRKLVTTGGKVEADYIKMSKGLFWLNLKVGHGLTN